jgi:hypothetical protein
MYNATPTETGGTTGNGVTIDIVGRSYVAPYRSSNLGSSYSGAFQPLKNRPDPGIDSGDDVKNAIDIEWASSAAEVAKSGNTFMRNYTSCLDGLQKFWLGHAGDTMTDLYDKVKEDQQFRLGLAEQYGIGFELPEFGLFDVPKSPIVPKNEGMKKAA